MDYEEREKLKQEGWSKFKDCKTPYGKMQILMHYIIMAHYWRAREELESSKKCDKYLKLIRGKKYYKYYQLDIDHYTEHWLFANKDQEFMKDGVFESCKEWYEPKESKYLPKGMSIYQFE